jgi:hypothetical protein
MQKWNNCFQKKQYELYLEKQEEMQKKMKEKRG